jgi:hypothetical protein
VRHQGEHQLGTVGEVQIQRLPVTGVRNLPDLVRRSDDATGRVVSRLGLEIT